MSADGVHSYEMPTTPDDDWPTDDPVLAAFAEDLRIVASGPAPEPRPGLVAAMRQGPIVPMGLQHERKTKRMPVKTFLGSLVAKLALGVGIATASVTAAGAAGVLPDAAQHAVSTVVDATTPFSIPDGSTVHAADVPLVDGSTTTTSTTVASSTTSTSTSTTVATKGTDDGTDTGGTAGVHPDNHGACVSTAAQSDTSSTGENHGKAVSAVAKSDCGKTTSTTVGSSTTSSTPTTVGGANPGATTNSGPGNSNGHGNSSGKGSSSKGGSGQD